MYRSAVISRSFDRIITDTPYHEDWLSAIKTCIPTQARDWNGEIWSFRPDYYEAVSKITEFFFPGRVINQATNVMERQDTIWKEKWMEWKIRYEGGQRRGRKSRPRTRRQSDRSWARKILFVTEDAPPEVIKAAYRALARVHHSDVGGDDEVMKDINRAKEALLG